MNDITSTAAYGSLAINNRANESEPSKELGQDAFLELMITQMENQSPLDPQNNTEFISQLAQFSSVEGLDKLNNSFDSFSSNFVANQALQASSLVGTSVSVPAESTWLNPSGVVGVSTEIPASTGDVRVNIYSASGALVDSMNLGVQPAGSMVMRWDGMNAELNGEELEWESSHAEGVAAGEYSFEVLTNVEGEELALDTNLSANVNSVTVGADGNLVLNLAGIGAVALSDVKQFNE
ncbi:MAG: flagellar basal-body rod modification protein FlgD [Flavobacteriales bacterium]|jgi:flagellar basal-body rod modification protein FlgD